MSRSEINNCSIQVLDSDPRFVLICCLSFCHILCVCDVLVVFIQLILLAFYLLSFSLLPWLHVIMCSISPVCFKVKSTAVSMQMTIVISHVESIHL